MKKHRPLGFTPHEFYESRLSLGRGIHGVLYLECRWGCRMEGFIEWFWSYFQARLRQSRCSCFLGLSGSVWLVAVVRVGGGGAGFLVLHGDRNVFKVLYGMLFSTCGVRLALVLRTRDIGGGVLSVSTGLSFSMEPPPVWQS